MKERSEREREQRKWSHFRTGHSICFQWGLTLFLLILSITREKGEGGTKWSQGQQNYRREEKTSCEVCYIFKTPFVPTEISNSLSPAPPHNTGMPVIPQFAFVDTNVKQLFCPETPLGVTRHQTQPVIKLGKIATPRLHFHVSKLRPTAMLS